MYLVNNHLAVRLKDPTLNRYFTVFTAMCNIWREIEFISQKLTRHFSATYLFRPDMFKSVWEYDFTVLISHRRFYFCQQSNYKLCRYRELGRI